MLRRFVVFTVIALSVISCVACSSGGAFLLDPQQALDTILAEVSFTDTLMEVNESTVTNFYPGLADITESYAIRISATAITTEEIAVVKAKEGSTAADVRAKLEARINEQKFRYESYLPEQLPKLENAVMEIKGDYVVLVVCDDEAKAKAVVARLLK